MMILSTMAIVWALIAALVSAFVWEYRTLDVKTNWRPSYPLERAASICNEFFTRIGSFVAWLCSFYAYVEWEKLLKTLERLFGPLFEIVLSWMRMFSGFAKYAYDHAIEIPLLHLGFCTIVLALLAIAWYWIPAEWWPDLSLYVPRLQYLGEEGGDTSFIGGGRSMESQMHQCADQK